MGASVAGVMFLLTKDLIRLVIPAFILATPIAYLAMERWLDGFAFSTQIGVMTFVLTLIGSILIAAVTIGYQAGRAAAANPVHSLRYE